MADTPSTAASTPPMTAAAAAAAAGGGGAAATRGDAVAVEVAGTAGLALVPYLERLPPDQLRALYQCPWCCQAVLHKLHPLAVQIVMQLLPVEIGITESILELCVRQDERALLAAVKEQMHRLRILIVNPNKAGVIDETGEVSERTHGLLLNHFFRQQIRDFLEDPQPRPWAPTPGSRTLAITPAQVQAVDAACARRWNSILEFLLGATPAQPLTPQVVRVLLSTGLLQLEDEDEDGGIGSKFVDSATPGAAHAALDRFVAADLGSAARDPADTAEGGDIRARLEAAMRTRRVKLSHRAYSFLLQDTEAQLWSFVRTYVDTSTSRGSSPAEVLRLLLRLGFCAPGDAIPRTDLSEPQQALLDDLASFGLVHVPGTADGSAAGTPGLEDARLSDFVIVSSLARALLSEDPTADDAVATVEESGGAGKTEGAGGDLTLASRGWASTTDAAAASSSAAATGGGGEGATVAASAPGALGPSAVQMRIIVENNLRVFAYSTEEVHARLLALFCDIDARLPNLIVARISRHSFGRALDRGIDAHTVHHFLRRRAHDRVLRVGGGLPENVVDQLHLWEEERTRITKQRVIQITDFDSRDEFQAVRQHLTDVGALVFATEEREVLVAKAQAAQSLREFVPMWRKSRQRTQ